MDYESMILARQEATEIWEDDPESPYLQPDPGDVVRHVIRGECPPLIDGLIGCQYAEDCAECWWRYLSR